jgi:peptidyl-prolyl cis-trans isomerase C
MHVNNGIGRAAIGPALAAAIVIFFATSPTMARAQVTQAGADPVVATVDGSPIHRSDVTEFQKMLPPQYQHMPIEVLYSALLDKLVEMKLVAEAGRKEHLENDKDVKERVAQVEERVIEEVYVQRLIEKSVTDAALHKRYDEYVKTTAAQQEISARHILVQTEDEAKDIRAQLVKGADFAQLARDKSIDPSAKAQGGDLGFFKRDEMVPEFSDAAFKLKDGEISQPVKTQYGWHIIKVEAHRTQQPSFATMKDKLAFDMSNEVRNDAVAKLRKTAKVERFNLDGSKPGAAAAPPLLPGAKPQ